MNIQSLQSNFQVENRQLIRVVHIFVAPVHNRAPQFKKVCLGNEVGSNMDQNDPLRLGFRSFASKLMDHDSIKVLIF